jgi:hypothetical protein
VTAANFFSLIKKAQFSGRSQINGMFGEVFLCVLFSFDDMDVHSKKSNIYLFV